MINFDSLSLKALINEFKPLLTGGRVHKVQQPSRNELLLTLRASGGNHKLYICVDPKYPHLALLSREGQELRSIEIPKTPPMFCMLLRKHMEGCKIKAIEQPGFNRIFELYFDSYSEVGQKVPMVLSCELMGKHSNIILYNYETNVILGCAHAVSSEKSREREVAGGLPYVYPPKQNKLDINRVSEEEFLGLVKIIPSAVNVWLNEKFGFLSKAIATEICNFCGVDTSENKISALFRDKAKCLYHRTKQIVNLEVLNPSLSSDMKLYSPVGTDGDNKWQSVESVNEMIDRYFGLQVFSDKLKRRKNSLFDIIKKELNKKKRLSAKHAKTVDSREKPERYREFADLIMANLYKIKNSAESVKAENIYKDNHPVEIPLNPEISATANAQKYYKLYNKAKTAISHSKELLKKVRDDIRYLEDVRESINQAETLEDLAQIRTELIEQGIITQKEFKKKEKEKIKPAKFISSEGFEIYAGKNNKQNEYILKNSSPEDIWLHAQDIPGSHVIINIPKSGDIPETTLHEAVYIAGWYSQGRNSSNVPVIYTKRKYVKKPAGSKPGFVIYTHEKTLWVNPEEEKILPLKNKE